MFQELKRQLLNIVFLTKSRARPSRAHERECQLQLRVHLPVTARAAPHSGELQLQSTVPDNGVLARRRASPAHPRGARSARCVAATGVLQLRAKTEAGAWRVTSFFKNIYISWRILPSVWAIDYEANVWDLAPLLAGNSSSNCDTIASERRGACPYRVYPNCVPARHWDDVPAQIVPMPSGHTLSMSNSQ